jgi:hypothetical protein
MRRLAVPRLLKPKAISPADPAARYTGANGDRPFFAYSTNYLSTWTMPSSSMSMRPPIRQAEVGITKDMILRTRERFGLYPGAGADTAYGSAPMLGWLVEEEGIEPYIPVIDKSERKDGTFSRDDFTYDRQTTATPVPAANSSCSSGAPTRRRALASMRKA